MKINKVLITLLAVGVLAPVALFAQMGPGPGGPHGDDNQMHGRGLGGPGGNGMPGGQDVQSLIQQLQEQIRLLQSQAGSLQSNTDGQVASLGRTLGKGSSGDDVKVLQAVLASDPDVFPQGTITGFFGPMTMDAVKKFQAKHGLEPVGSVGPKTLAALQGVLASNPIAFESDDNLLGDEGTTTGTTTGDHRGMHGMRLCAKVPPGHFIAKGWLRKTGMMPIVPECQKLPPGILNLLNGMGTTTASTTATTSVRIRGIGVESVSSDSATIMWHTNVPASSMVYFGTTSPIDLTTGHNAGSNTLVTDHSITLEPLVTGTTYDFIVVSASAAGNSATSSVHTFRTN